MPVQKGALGYDDHQHIVISRGGRSSKIHAVVDGLGYHLVLELTGGHVHNGVMLQICLEQLDISGSTVLAKWRNREYITNHDADFCIPPKSNSVDPWYTDYYKKRHLVECLFHEDRRAPQDRYALREARL